MATVWFSAVRRRGYQFSGLSNDRKRADNVYRIDPRPRLTQLLGYFKDGKRIWVNDL